jgi:hypothetical protein
VISTPDPCYELSNSIENKLERERERERERINEIQ